MFLSQSLFNFMSASSKLVKFINFPGFWVGSVDLITVFYLSMELVGGLRELPVVGLHLISFLSGWAVLRPQKI